VPTQIDVAHGAFHLKPASLPRGPGYVAVKVNGNFPDNRARHGLPTIQGAVLLADASNGRPLALLDSAEITLQRTGAATAVAARHLAGRMRAPRRSAAAARKRRCSSPPCITRSISVASSPGTSIRRLREATRVSDAIVTCTPARVPFLGLDDVPAAGFVAAVGADNPAKSEIKPELMARAIVVVDVLDQAVVMGDVHHAVAAGAMRAQDVHAELGQAIAGTRPGRRDDDAIIVFDSSGTGILDAAAAAVAYEVARQRGLGMRCSLT
jgi:ornithine cyclodeaminase/alanine dehydrogenase-like protein (mu-crystallin family)